MGTQRANMGNGAMKHCHDVKVETIADMGFAEKEVRAALSKPGRDVIPTRYKRGGQPQHWTETRDGVSRQMRSMGDPCPIAAAEDARKSEVVAELADKLGIAPGADTTALREYYSTRGN